MSPGEGTGLVRNGLGTEKSSGRRGLRRKKKVRGKLKNTEDSAQASHPLLEKERSKENEKDDFSKRKKRPAI